MTNYWDIIVFETPWMLLLFILLPALWYWDRKWVQKRQALPYSSLQLLPESKGWRAHVYVYSRYLRYGVISMGIIALARPVIPLTEEVIEADSIEIALSIDLSSSMLAQDFVPNRLEASKEVARNFVLSRPYDLFSLIAFAAESYTLSPLSADRDLLARMIDGLACGMLEDGTAIGMGLANAVNRLKDGNANTKIIILLTDGVNNTGYIQPMTAANIAQELGIKVYTIGVGSMGEALSPVSRRADGQYIFGYTRVEIDEALLKEISAMTGGKYFRATDNLELTEVYAEIDQLEKTKIEITTIRTYKEQYRWFLLIAGLLWALEIFIRKIWIKVWP